MDDRDSGGGEARSPGAEVDALAVARKVRRAFSLHDLRAWMRGAWPSLSRGASLQWRALASTDAAAVALTVTEYRAFWESMAADRGAAAATLVWLIARVVALSFPDDRADVADVISGILLAAPAPSPASSAAARPALVRLDTRRQHIRPQPHPPCCAPRPPLRTWT
jgi:hypothetical protein